MSSGMIYHVKERGEEAIRELIAIFDGIARSEETIEFLYIVGYIFTREHAKKLCEFLMTSTQIQCVQLTFENMSSTIFDALARALCFTVSLKDLHIRTLDTFNEQDYNKLIFPLRINDTLRCGKYWSFSSDEDNHNIERIREIATELGHPTLLDIAIILCSAPVRFSQIKRHHH